jgi:hypothetical protein
LNSFSSFTHFFHFHPNYLITVTSSFSLINMVSYTLTSIACLALGAAAVPLNLADLVGGQGGNGHVSLQLDINLGQEAFRANNFGGGDLFHFTSTHSIHALPENVVDGTTPTGGIAGASGIFNYGINSQANM